MSRFLDDRNVTKANSGPIFQEAGRSQPLGEEVPSKLHFSLEMDILATFMKGDLVGYDEEGNGEYYLYAKVIKELDEDKVKIQINDNEDDEESFVEAPRSKLYAFIQRYRKPQQKQPFSQPDLHAGVEISLYRKRSHTENRESGQEQNGDDEEPDRSYEEITEEIRKIIIDLKSKDKEEQKRVFRRLFLKWHPDKHKNEELSTKVF